MADHGRSLPARAQWRSRWKVIAASRLRSWWATARRSSPGILWNAMPCQTITCYDISIYAKICFDPLWYDELLKRVDPQTSERTMSSTWAHKIIARAHLKDLWAEDVKQADAAAVGHPPVRRFKRWYVLHAVECCGMLWNAMLYYCMVCYGML